ncbi:MAG: hypothetical protein CVU44_14625 [Chloroflexi bacterium HGW-Chloroflexi-6]|nr:MAG: hypothetical protein CVU44_14625 [Chloroflexi bacterium HGW-Chloroflexi-6]
MPISIEVVFFRLGQDLFALTYCGCPPDPWTEGSCRCTIGYWNVSGMMPCETRVMDMAILAWIFAFPI